MWLNFPLFRSTFSPFTGFSFYPLGQKRKETDNNVLSRVTLPYNGIVTSGPLMFRVDFLKGSLMHSLLLTLKDTVYNSPGQ